LTSHELYDRLGRTAATRQQEHRALFRATLNQDFVQDLRAATNGGWALGDARFKRQIAQALGRRVVPLPKGRPPKAGAAWRQLKLKL
jgi:putative transposase